MKYIIHTYFVLIFIISGCGEQLDLLQFPINQPPPVIGDTVYIPQYPILTGFNDPTDIYVGNEPLLYIADKDNNRIVQMDLAGGIVSYSNFILKPRKIAQDRYYDLLVLASVIDTIPPNILDTVDAVFRFKLQPNGGILAGVRPGVVFKSNQPTPLPGNHGKFTGIAVFSNNYYLVARSGPNNSSLIDPDNAIFKIDKYDNTQPVPFRLSGFETIGQGLLSLQKVSAIAAFQNNNTDFIYTQDFTDAVFKIQWVTFDYVDEIYLPKFTPEDNVDLLRNGLVSQPEDITIDNSGNIYVIDSYKDSLYKFSSLGRLKSESFGGEGNSPTQFINPTGVAFFYRTLYICDTGNNRVIRYILSTDIQQ
jgi:DNA-binding beta-propeller fold protein YncE